MTQFARSPLSAARLLVLSLILAGCGVASGGESRLPIEPSSGSRLEVELPAAVDSGEEVPIPVEINVDAAFVSWNEAVFLFDVQGEASLRHAIDMTKLDIGSPVAGVVYLDLETLEDDAESGRPELLRTAAITLSIELRDGPTVTDRTIVQIAAVDDDETIRLGRGSLDELKLSRIEDLFRDGVITKAEREAEVRAIREGPPTTDGP